MSYFTCEKCGEKIYPIDGLISWQREGGVLRNFQITHRECSDPENNACVTLFDIDDEKGFMGFIKYLFYCWADGLILEGHESLTRVMTQLYGYRLHRFSELLKKNK